MKYWLSHLPLEVWVDCYRYPWISREELAQMVDKIGNRWFGEQLQFYLHEWGKHTIGHLQFTKQEVKKWHNCQDQPLDFPQTAMPENIKFCKSIRIDHFDNQVYNFFRRIRSLLTANTRLEIRFPDPDSDEQVNNARTILGHLLPFIDGIHTISTDNRMLPILGAFPSDKFHQIKVFDVILFAQSTVEPIMDWLTTSIINNNEPKLLKLYCFTNQIAQQVLETIREKFMEAMETSTFVVMFSNYHNLPAFQCENAIGEQLCGIKDDENVSFTKFKVLRHQANAEAGDKLRKLVDGNMHKKGAYAHDWKQSIRLFRPTIGDERVFAMPDLDVDEADQEEEDEPSTSKKRRICK